MAATPQIGASNDFAALAPYFEAAATEVGLPYEVLVAQSLQESAWKLKAYRYEPNYDRRYVSSPKGELRWKADSAWLTTGPTVLDWFSSHTMRGNELTAGQDYHFVAQTRIAASYGPNQLMYPTAVDLGFKGLPEALYEPTSVRLGAKLLGIHYRLARQHGWREREALMIALASYNGGSVGNSNPAALRNQAYVQTIARRFKQCWGRELFP